MKKFGLAILCFLSTTGITRADDDFGFPAVEVDEWIGAIAGSNQVLRAESPGRYKIPVRYHNTRRDTDNVPLSEFWGKPRRAVYSVLGVPADVAKKIQLCFNEDEVGDGDGSRSNFIKAGEVFEVEKAEKMNSRGYFVQIKFLDGKGGDSSKRFAKQYPNAVISLELAPQKK